jgi:hypothetical protein
MSYALNEVEAMAKRAARGAGHPWGLAEEAAKATRWLSAQGLDGVAVLDEALAQGGDALVIGASLSDHAARLADGPIEIADLPQPVMILPFAALAARQIRDTVSVTCSAAVAVTDGRRLGLSGKFPPETTVTIIAGAEPFAPRPQAGRATPDAAAWDRLTGLARRTYAPATEESRRLGAGAGLSDND